MTRPKRLTPLEHPFALAVQAHAVGLGLTALVCLPWVPAYLIGVCLIIGGVTILRVPRRLRVAEATVCFGILGVSGGGLIPVWGLVAGLALIASAPERRLLPLNGLDRYFVAQDYPGTHVNSHVFLDTDRPLQRAALEAAVDDLAREIPLGHSFLREGVLGAQRFEARSLWFEPAGLITWLDRVSAEAEAALLDVRFDLEAHPPWRVSSYPRPEGGGWRTVLTIHHTAADGTGQMVWIEALLRRYTDHLTGRRPDPLPEVVREPHPRFRDVLDTRGPLWMLRMIKKHVHPLAKLGVLNASLLEDEQATPEPPRHAVRTIDAGVMADLAEAATKHGATRNHLLIAAVLLAGTVWRAKRNKPARPWRLLLPTDLRPILELEACLGNYAGAVPLVLSLQEVTGDLIGTIRARVHEGRSLEESIEAPVNVGVVSLLIPPWLFRRELEKFDTDPDTFWFSTLFSAIRPLPGLALPTDVAVDRLWVRGGMPAHPGLGWVLARDRGQTHVAVEYRPPLIRPQAVEELLDAFEAEVVRLAAS